MKYNLQHHQQLCDFLTPVQTYLLLRDEGHSSVLFESTDYHSRKMPTALWHLISGNIKAYR